MNEFLAAFPRVVLAVLGMVGLNLNTLGGYFAALAYYVTIIIAIYAVHLGSNSISRETIDKTYEFLFTKPRTRLYILSMKLRAAWIFLLCAVVLNYVYSLAAIATLDIENSIQPQMLLFSLAVFVIGSVFLSLSAFVSAAVKNAEKGSLIGNLLFVFAFIMGIIYDMLENEAF